MKKIIFLLLIVVGLSGCGNTYDNPADYQLNRCEFSGATKHLCSARLGDVILFEANKSYGVYLKCKKDAQPKKVKELNRYSICKITSSDKYFYVSAQQGSDDECKVFVLDKDGKIIEEKKCCCEWIYVYGNTVMGYYNGHDETDGADGWTSERIEVTHYINEKKFLEAKEDDISNWKKISGDTVTIGGKTLIRQVDSKEEVIYNKVPYYTDMVYYDVTYEDEVLDCILYVGGKIVSAGTVEEKAEKYIKQLQDIMGKKEKDFGVYSWQIGDEVVGVCNVYNQSGGFLQQFADDIKYGFTFRYNPKSDTVSIIKKYNDKNLIYYDGHWLIYSNKKGVVYKESMDNEEKDRIFKGTGRTWVDVSDGILTMGDVYDTTENSPEHKEDAFLLR